MPPTTSLLTKDEHSTRRKALQANQQSTSSVFPTPIQQLSPNAPNLTPSQVLYLQRAVGNQAVLGLINRNSPAPAMTTASPGVQRAIAVGPADDLYEREADRIAKSAVGNSGPQKGQTQPHTPESIQREPIGPEGGALQANMESRLRQTQSSGSSLPQSVRNQIEPKLGADLSRVKVHTGKEAVQLTQEMGAKAFTHQNHIYYGAGHAPSDLKLTAHEAVHTIQQGAVQQRAQRLPDDQISHAAKPVVSRVPAQIQRWGWWDRRKRRQLNMTDSDVVDQTRGDGGSLNRVDKVRYQRNIGRSKSKTGFFKPNEISDKGTDWESENTGMAHRAVASSLLDKWLGTNILSEEVWAKHGGESGSVSAMVSGSPLQEVQFNTPVDPNTFDESRADPTQHKKVNGVWHTFSGVRQKYHDYSNPRTQKGLSDLQLLDAITGQVDRHGGNIFIDDTTGGVKGIDNDQAFHLGTNYIDKPDDRYHGLPNLVDERTAKRILKKKAKHLPKMLGSKYGGNLDPQEIKNAQDRMREVKRHLKQLKKDKKLVKKWDDTTYLKALGENDKQGHMNKMFAPNMLKRVAMNYAQANDRELPGDIDTLQISDLQHIDEITLGESALYGMEEELETM